MNADKRNEILSALGSLRMIPFFETKKWIETSVKQGKNTW